MDLGILRSICDQINQSWRSSQVQKIWTTDQALVLEIYNQQSFWLVIENTHGGQLWIFDHRPEKYKLKKVTPLGLFLQAHLQSLYLREAEIQADLGRVLSLFFENKYKKTSIEIVCVPGVFNILAETQDEEGVKKIALHRPVELPKVQWEQIDNRAEYDWLRASDESLQVKDSKIHSEKKSENSLQKLILKKKKAMQAIQEKNQQTQQQQQEFRRLAELLKLGPLSEEDEKKISVFQLDPRWNPWQMIQALYEKAKLFEVKIQGGQQRLQLLQSEVEKLEKQNSLEDSDRIVKDRPALNFKKSGKDILQLRKLDLSDGLVAYFGKNAKDNLQLLRQAKPWYLWVHLKDYPSCYGIIYCLKNQKVPSLEIEKVAFWILQDFYKNKTMIPSKLDVVVCECRHVHPLKGDQIGRVTYHHPENFTFTFRDKN